MHQDADRTTIQTRCECNMYINARYTITKFRDPDNPAAIVYCHESGGSLKVKCEDECADHKDEVTSNSSPGWMNELGGFASKTYTWTLKQCCATCRGVGRCGRTTMDCTFGANPAVSCETTGAGWNTYDRTDGVGSMTPVAVRDAATKVMKEDCHLPSTDPPSSLCQLMVINGSCFK